MVQENGFWVIPPEGLAEYINTKRGKRNRHPIEHNVINTRLMIKMQSNFGKRIDFTGQRIKLDAEGLEQLEEVINEQFDLALRGDLRKVFRYDAPSPKPARQPAEEPPPTQPEVADKAGFGSRFRRLFGA